MRVVIAPDSFKGTLSAVDAGRAMASGVRKVDKRIETTVIPMADGGEGTIEVWMGKQDGRLTTVTVTNPLGEPVQAAYLTVPGRKAVIELASASGLLHVPEWERTPVNALRATTYGTGELVLHAIEQGAETIVIALGGSGTIDGGYGLLRALGATYYDMSGNVLDGKDARQLASVGRIDVKGLHPRFYDVEFVLACDVTNVLCGPDGAAHMFGPQKGLDGDGVEARDNQLLRFAALVRDAFSIERQIQTLPSSGAAGGAGLPFFVPERTRVVLGSELMAEVTELERFIAEADFVMTGEGRADGQSAKGKVPAYVAQLAERYNKPCVVVAGSLGDGYEGLFDKGVTHMIAATPEHAEAKTLKEHAGEWVSTAAYHAALDMQKGAN